MGQQPLLQGDDARLTEIEKTPRLQGTELYDWIRKEIEKYKTRVRRAAALYIVAALVSFFSPLVLALPPDARPTFVATEVALLGLSLFGASRLNERAERLLPPVEDRVLYRLQPAVVSLKAYIRDGNDAERKNAVKNIKRVARILDRWSAGNLRFLKEGVGRDLNEFTRNFRGRVLNAIERPNKTTIPDLVTWLTNFQNALETDTMNDVSLRTWNQNLSEASQTDQSVPKFPMKAARANVLTRLISQWFRVTVAFLVFIAPLVTGLIGVYIAHASVDASFMSAATVFAGMLVLLVAVTRQRGI